MKKWIVSIVLIGMLGWVIYDFTLSDEINTEENSSKLEVSHEEIGLEKGNIAPDFTLETLSGEEVSLSDFRGERVMLNFLGNMVSAM